MKYLLTALSFLSLLAAPAAQAEHSFDPVYRVLTHPRCLNCHTNGNFPRQGDEGRPHDFLVQRGTHDKGVAGFPCASCHQASNNDASKVPGAPHWQAAPLAMGWEGKSPAQLCRQLKDRRRNGNRSLQALVEHMDTEPLVQWAWAPGATRAPVEPGKAAFMEAFRRWVDEGGPCPTAR